MDNRFYIIEGLEEMAACSEEQEIDNDYEVFPCSCDLCNWEQLAWYEYQRGII